LYTERHIHEYIWQVLNGKAISELQGVTQFYSQPDISKHTPR